MLRYNTYHSGASELDAADNTSYPPESSMPVVSCTVYESKRLIKEKILPLTPSGSKYIMLGANPNDDFKPWVRIASDLKEEGIEFNEPQFKEFMVWGSTNVGKNELEGVLSTSQPIYWWSSVG